VFTNLAVLGEFVIAVHRETCYTPNEKQLFTQGAFDKSFRTVLTGLTAIYAFVISCQTGLRSLTVVRLFSQDCPETCQNGRCRDSDHPDTQELEQASSMADRVN